MLVMLKQVSVLLISLLLVNGQDEEYTTGEKFVCTEDLTPSATIPTSVHKLRPADIKVVAALGDSVTAGFGEEATSIANYPIEYRGVSWTIGGQKDMETQVTIPSVLKKYNSNLYGYATGIGGPGSAKGKFDVAVSGAIGKGIPGQANALINAMKKDRKVDYQNDWKLVSLWIGGNDLCDSCDGNAANKPAQYTKYIKEALDNFKNNMPHTFVNLILILDVTMLYEFKDASCVGWHDVLCHCGGSKDDKKRAIAQEYAKQYQTMAVDLAKTYEGLSNFTVVTQPFWINTTLPTVGGKPDHSYFSVDCFHFSLKGHDAGAIALWRNMFQPIGAKQTSWVQDEKILCPTEKYPYLFTASNSIGILEEWLSDRNISATK